jgi:hypothetical protein
MKDKDLVNYLKKLKKEEDDSIYMMAGVTGAESNLQFLSEDLRKKMADLLDVLVQDTKRHSVALDKIINYLSC